MELFVEPNRHVEIVKGYFQTYEYFLPDYERQIRASFDFLPEIRQRARQTVDGALAKSLATISSADLSSTVKGRMRLLRI